MCRKVLKVAHKAVNNYTPRNWDLEGLGEDLHFLLYIFLIFLQLFLLFLSLNNIKLPNIEKCGLCH